MKTTIKEKWISQENYKEYINQMASYAIQNRLSNYGYNWQDFKKMSQHKSRLNRIAKIKLLNNKFSDKYAGIYSRFYFPKNSDKITYCTGQSQNEEMITVLECLTGTYKD